MDIASFGNEIWAGIQLVYERGLFILHQPASNPEMLWILLPLLATMFLIELYFGRYKEETLGWNSAVGNSIVLFFVSVNLFSYLYRSGLLITVSFIPPQLFSVALQKSIITFIILLESILLLFLNFFHLMPKSLAFGVSSAMIINFTGVIAVILVYSSTPVDIVTLLAVLSIFICVAIFFKIIQSLEPKAASKEEEEDEDEILEKI
jgi:hypothetical protein